MARFCSECGTAIEQGAKFCGQCGSAIGNVAGSPHPDTGAVTASSVGSGVAAPAIPEMPGTEAHYDDAASDMAGSNTTRNILIGAGAIVALGLATFAAYHFSTLPQESDPALGAPTEAAKVEDPNAPRPQEWFDTYSDKYLSAELTRLATDSAAKRNFPTSRGSEILEQVASGMPVSGRWVEGADPATRWLKTTDGGYIWEGNLGPVETITPSGMLGLMAGASFPTLRNKIDPEGHYGSQVDDWETDACEIYTTLDGQADVMVESGRATAFITTNSKLATAKGIRVGSSEANLKKAYGSSLEISENPYDGQDYFLWQGKDRGIKFHVSAGQVDVISSGSRSIQYVEGCL